MYTSVGMVVSYVFYPSGTAISQNGQLNHPQLEAGIFEVRTPYNKAESVVNTLTQDNLGNCTVTGPKSGVSDAAKYCPVIYANALSTPGGK
jgi:hypothetical protein